MGKKEQLRTVKSVRYTEKGYKDKLHAYIKSGDYPHWQHTHLTILYLPQPTDHPKIPQSKL
jgi:hypothetical protein